MSLRNEQKVKEEYLKQQIISCEERYRELQGIMRHLSEENQELKDQHMQLTQKIGEIRNQIDNLIAKSCQKYEIINLNSSIETFRELF